MRENGGLSLQFEGNQPRVLSGALALDAVHMEALSHLHLNPVYAQLLAAGPAGEEAFRLASGSRADVTRRNYETYARQFIDFCRAEGRDLSVVSTACFLAELFKRKRAFGTCKSAKTAINYLFTYHGLPPLGNSFVVHDVLRGIEKESAPARRKTPIRIHELGVLSQLIDRDENVTRGIRDRALFLLMYFAGLRPGSLRDLTLGNLTWITGGLQITITHSKTNQTNKDEFFVVYYCNDINVCPLRALQAWLSRRGNAPGILFREVWLSGKIGAPLAPGTLNRRLKTYAQALGYEEHEISSYSLRRGSAISEAEALFPETHISRRLGHRSPRSLQPYLDDAKLPINVTQLIGL
jgi:integrase